MENGCLSTRSIDLNKIRRWAAGMCLVAFLAILFGFSFPVNAAQTVTLGTPTVSVNPEYGDSYTPTVTGVPSGKSATFKYYSDSAGTSEISQPTTPGTYYVKAFFAATGDYSAAESPVGSFQITRRKITQITGITAANKTYDRRADATLNFGDAVLTGVINNDNVTITSANGYFSDANVGSAKSVSISNIVLGGANADRYALYLATSNAVNTPTADITPISIAGCTVNLNPSTPVTVTGSTITASVQSVYDPSLDAYLSPNDYTVSGTLSATAAGTYTVTVTGKNNYLSSTSASGTWTIKKAAGKATITVKSIAYGKTPSPHVNSDTNSGASYTITYQKSGSSTTTTNVPSEPGVYTATVTYAATDMYDAATASTTFSIAEKSNTVTSVPGKTSTPFSTSKSTVEQNKAAQDAYKNTKTTAPANDYSKTSRSMFGDFTEYYNQQVAEEAKKSGSTTGSGSLSQGSGSGSATGTSSASGSSSGSGSADGSTAGSADGTGSAASDGSAGEDEPDEEYDTYEGMDYGAALDTAAGSSGTVTVNSGIYDSTQYNGKNPVSESNTAMIAAGGGLLLVAEVFLILGINGLTHGAVTRGFRSFTSKLTGGSKKGKKQ